MTKTCDACTTIMDVNILLLIHTYYKKESVRMDKNRGECGLNEQIERCAKGFYIFHGIYCMRCLSNNFNS